MPIGVIFVIYRISFLSADTSPARAAAMLMVFRQGHTASGILRSLPILVLAFVLPLCQVAAQEDVQRQSPAQVLEDLLARHGDNSTISVPQLRSLLALLSQGDADAVRPNVTTTTAPPKLNNSKVRAKKNRLVPK